MEANNQKIAHATDSEQSAKTAPQTSLSATNQTDSATDPSQDKLRSPTPEKLAQLQAIATPYLDWVDRAISQVKQTRILSAHEKDRAVSALENHRRRLGAIISGWTPTFDLFIDDDFIRRLSREFPPVQASMNREMAFYEVITPYPLPASVVPNYEQPDYYQTYWTIGQTSMPKSVPPGCKANVTLIEQKDWATASGVLLVVYRAKKRTLRHGVVGRALNTIRSKKELALYFEDYEYMVFPLSAILFIYKVDSVTIAVK